MLPGPRLAILVAGILLLVAGRRLYWLLVGLVGFVLGFFLVGEIIPTGPQWLVLAAGLIAGLVASFVAVFFQRVAVAVAGFLIGGFTLYWWAIEIGWQQSWWLWLIVLAAGLAGSYLTRALFEMALVVLSSAAGAIFVLDALQRPAQQIGPLFLVLVISGVVCQFLLARRRRSA